VPRALPNQSRLLRRTHRLHETRAQRKVDTCAIGSTIALEAPDLSAF
jgi:hypothetical protein